MFKIIPLAFLIWLFVFDKPALTYAQVIHKTRSGDTLTKIAVQYNTKTVSLAKLNGLNKNSHLVLGQAILIPGSSYIVQPGRATVLLKLLINMQLARSH